MLHKSLVTLAMVALWAVVAAVCLACVNAAPHLWRAEVGAAVAAAIAGAWFTSGRLLRQFGVEVPYRPE